MNSQIHISCSCFFFNAVFKCLFRLDTSRDAPTWELLLWTTADIYQCGCDRYKNVCSIISYYRHWNTCNQWHRKNTQRVDRASPKSNVHHTSVCRDLTVPNTPTLLPPPETEGGPYTRATVLLLKVFSKFCPTSGNFKFEKLRQRQMMNICWFFTIGRILTWFHSTVHCVEIPLCLCAHPGQ